MLSDGSWVRGKPIWTWGDSAFSLYPIMMMTGILLAFLTICYFWKRQKYPWEILQVIIIIGIPTAIFGARLWFVMFNPKEWSQFFYFSGLAIQGGVIFGSAAVFPYLYSKRHVVDIRTTIGIILPSIFIGQVIGRIGNFTNHEVYGQVVDGNSLNWLDWIGIKGHMFIRDSISSPPSYRAPFFLYEMFGTLSGYILVVWIILYRNLVRPGVTAGLYILIYGIIRTLMEPLRDPVDIIAVGNIQVSTITSILMILFGLFLVIWWQFFTRPFYPFIKRLFASSFLKKIHHEYVLITPIKPRRKYLWFGKKQDKRCRYTFFGPKVINYVRIWIPRDDEGKWSKREINAGHKKLRDNHS